MAQTEGEKEIVLGNKQLISLFFVVAALLGVFFAAGYMIGRKSVTPAVSGETAPLSGATASPQPQSEPAREAAASPDPDPAVAQPAPNQPEQRTAPAESQPERTGTKPARAEDRPQEKAKARAQEKEEKRDPVAERPARKIADTAVTKPEPGATYLQVTALRHPDADNLVRSLREQNFPTTLADSSKEGLFRVLVGPYHETAKVADAKARLKALGFANAFVQR